jgi:hypothetical protein
MTACLAVGLIPLASFAARVYQSTAPDGSTVFSDQPSPLARELDITVPASVPPQQAADAPVPVKAAPAPTITVSYRTLKISEPKNDGLFWFADGPVKVQADIVPPLAEGHVLVPLLNGIAQGEGVAGNAFALTDLDPDTYQLVLVIRDAKGRELKRSAPVRFHFRRQSTNLPARKPPPPPKSGG